jgi:hypothetical protein
MNEVAIVIDNLRETSHRWRGSIGERYSNISRITYQMNENQAKWNVPKEMLNYLTENSEKLQKLIAHCDTSDASASDRQRRSTLLKTLMAYCRKNVKLWAFGRYEAGGMTSADVHLLGFILPGDLGGRRSRHEPTMTPAWVKVKEYNGDVIRVTLNKTVGEHNAQIGRGWPDGVRQALIVVMTTSGKEICRKTTSRLRNVIAMPKGAHGKQFFVQASFLKHLDDDPLFGNQALVSLPRDTVDLLAEAAEARAKANEIDILREENTLLRTEIELLKKG